MKNLSRSHGQNLGGPHIGPEIFIFHTLDIGE